MISTISYGIGAGAFLALIALILIKRAPRGLGIFVLLSCLLTFFWMTAAALQRRWGPSGAQLLESAAFGAWVLLLARMIKAAQDQAEPAIQSWQIKILTILAPAVAIASLVNDARFFRLAADAAFYPSQVIFRIAVAVCGILLVENLFRNTPPERRWHIFPFSIAVGFGFAYNLFVFCEAVVLKNPDPPLLAARGVVWALIVPLLALTMARNSDWKIDVHVSRKIVFHGATLTAGGVFLLLAAGVATQIGRLPGEWGPVSKILFFSGSIIVLLIVLSAGGVRARVQRFIAENFYSVRYDYRIEWLRSISMLSAGTEGEALSARAIRAIADVVNSPGGMLWAEAGGGVYSIVDTLNVRVDRSTLELAGGAFVAGFGDGTVLQEIATLIDPPVWTKSFWLAIPLAVAGRLSGFMVLSRPRAAESLDWETRDLLLALGQQVAAFIAQERSSRALVESQALIDYSKRFSFIAHDIKNVAGQLTLAAKNIAEFGEEPEFRIDLVASLKNSIEKLNALLARLRPEGAAAEQPCYVDAMQAVLKAISESHGGAVSVRLKSSAEMAKVRIAPSAIQAALSHLIRNALEASEVGNEIFIDIRRHMGRVIVEIEDEGRGMTRDFVQNDLFAPARSTKSRGHGIGAYQARELIRAAGGDIQVVSEVGVGTRVSIVLPDAEGRADHSQARRVAG